MGEHYNKFWIPNLKHLNMLNAVKHDAEVPDSDIDLDYIIDRCMFVGNPKTVEQRIADMVGATGGFGCLLVNTVDHVDDWQGWRDSVGTLSKDIMPKFADVGRAE